MSRVRQHHIGGLVEDNPLAAGATTLTSADLVRMREIVAPDYMAIMLDPDGRFGIPEIAYVTAHGDGEQTATLLRGQEQIYGSSAARKHERDTPWFHGPTAGDFGTSIRDLAWTRSDGPHDLDDEFNDASLNEAWTRIDVNELDLVYTEAADVLSVKHPGGAGDTAGPAHCLVKPLGALTPPVTIEAAFRYFRRYATNHQMFGLIMTDGTDLTSQGTWMMPYSSSSTATAWTLSVRSFNDLNAGEVAMHGNETWELIGGPLYQRMVWVSSNTFRCEWSPDGVSWHQFPTSDISRTMTPTHIGFAMSTWLQNTPGCIGTVEYFRVKESVG